MPSAVAVQNVGVGPCRGGACGDILEATARISLSQPNEAMARFALPLAISLDTSCRVEIPEKVFLDLDSKFFSKGQIDSKRGLGSAVPGKTTTTARTHNFSLAQHRLLLDTHLYCSAFLGNFRTPHRGTFLGPLVCGANKPETTSGM
jgi:hypothetical protein